MAQSDNQSFSFRVPGTPPTSTQQERKISWKYRRTYLDPKAKQARFKIESAIRARLNDASEESIRYPNGTIRKKPLKNSMGFPWDDPVTLQVRFFFGTKQKHLWGTPKATKPDVDNLLKSLLDSLQATGVITNDSRIVSVKAEKYWCEPGGDEGIEVVVERIDATPKRC